MNVMDELCRRRRQVQELWLKRVLSEYPPETARLLSASRDPFTNPAGRLLEEGAAQFVEAVFQDSGMQSVPVQFERLLQLRAVQGQPPSQALRFLLQLRPACRQVVADGDFAELDRRLDEAVLLALDCYLGHRERLAEVRIAELKRSCQSVLRRFRGDPELSLEGEERS